MEGTNWVWNLLLSYFLFLGPLFVVCAHPDPANPTLARALSVARSLSCAPAVLLALSLSLSLSLSLLSAFCLSA
eukprot:2318828-Rhodomonas_salina.1